MKRFTQVKTNTSFYGDHIKRLVFKSRAGSCAQIANKAAGNGKAAAVCKKIFSLCASACTKSPALCIRSCNIAYFRSKAKPEFTLFRLCQCGCRNAKHQYQYDHYFFHVVCFVCS